LECEKPRVLTVTDRILREHYQHSVSTLVLSTQTEVIVCASQRMFSSDC